ncbi:MAG: hypothetical protein IH605_15365 [Burkholderiales bacterium]|nr:hypothetical protein [Burkholderiales bacterium]
MHWETARKIWGERRRGDRIGSGALLRAVQGFMRRLLFYHRCPQFVSAIRLCIASPVCRTAEHLLQNEFGSGK